MREVYNKKKKYAVITQGSVITGCLAKGYEDCQVWGCIITARCDLAHSKMDVVHYLPIVNFKDWLSHEIVDDIRKGWAAELRNNISNKFNQKKISSGFIDRKLLREDFEKIVRANFKKNIDEIMEEYDKFQSALTCPISVILNEKKGESALRDEISRLIRNDNNHFYLLEDWYGDNDVSQYKVILLREIKEISLKCALQLPDGIIESEQEHSFFENNNLACSVEKNNFYYVDSEIKSPFIEHILQRFTNNFSRVGVEDLPKAEVLNELVKFSKKVLS